MTKGSARDKPQLLRSAALPPARAIARPGSDQDLPADPAASKGFSWGKTRAAKPAAQRISAWGNLAGDKTSSPANGGGGDSRARKDERGQAAPISPLARSGSTGATGSKPEASPPKPADLRRAGPFATDDTKAAQAARAAPSLSAARLNAQPGAAAQGPVLRLDDFEAPAKNWQRKRLDPAAPRVHPNPVPVAVASRKALEANVTSASLAGNLGQMRKATRKLTQERARTKSAKARRSGSDRWYYLTLFAISALIIGLLINWYNQQMTDRPPTSVKTLSESEKILQAEQALASLGFDPGRQDGQADFQFQAAIVQFQNFAGLPANGRLSDELLAELQALTQLGGN